MKWLASLWRRLTHFRKDSDLEDELRAHVEMQADDYEGVGYSRREALWRARVQLGKSRPILERIRDQELLTSLESWYRDIVLGLRALRQNPVFSVTAIVTLAVGIGANTAIFTLLDGLLLRSLRVREAGELVRIGLVIPSSTQPGAHRLPYRMLQQLRRQQKSFTEISSWHFMKIALEDSEGDQHMQDAGFVSGNGFALLGVHPHLGRLIMPADDLPGGPAGGWPAVLSHSFWMERYAGDSSIVGKQIRLTNTFAVVVGVAPADFRGVWHGSEPKLYLPQHCFPVVFGIAFGLDAPTSFQSTSAIARLRPGVSLEAAKAEMAVYQNVLFREFLPPAFLSSTAFAGTTLGVESARAGLPTFFGQVYATPLLLMQCLVATVLLLCCVNVGGLLMSRLYARQHEFALRTAIGAGRWRLTRQYLVESFVIATIGAALGTAVAWYGIDDLLPFFRHPMEGVAMAVQPDRSILFATALCAAVATLLFGTIPAWKAGGADPGAMLKSRTASGARQIAGRMFIPLQVGLALVLVVLASCFSQSLIRLQTENTGFDVDHVTIQTAPFHTLKLTPEAKLALYQRMADRLEQLPGVTSATVTWYTPMTGYQATAGFHAVTDRVTSPEDSQMSYNQVGSGYFRTMKTTILDGRGFEKQDRGRDVCILNQSAALHLFGREQPMGRHVRSGDQTAFPEGLTCRVIGVARDAKFASLREPPPRTIYFPVSPATVANYRNLVFLINATSKATAIAAYRNVLRELAPALPMVGFFTLREQMDAALGSDRALTLMSNFFSAVALFLSALGLYGLLSASVAQRRPEIGVRMTLGARRGTVLRMILNDGLKLLAVGLVVGLVGLAVSFRFVEGLLYGVSPFEPMRLAAIVGVLIVVTLASGFIPAWRACSIDPIRALRAD